MAQDKGGGGKWQQSRGPGFLALKCVPYMLKPCLGPLRALGDWECPQDLALFALAWGRCHWLSPLPTPRDREGALTLDTKMREVQREGEAPVLVFGPREDASQDFARSTSVLPEMVGTVLLDRGGEKRGLVFIPVIQLTPTLQHQAIRLLWLRVTPGALGCPALCTGLFSTGGGSVSLRTRGALAPPLRGQPTLC